MKKIRYGIPALLELAGAEECAALCQELSFDFVELNMNLPQYQPCRLEAAGLRRLQEEYGVYFTLHLDENANPFDFNPRVAEAWSATSLEALEAAREAGIPLLNMHLPKGVCFTLPDRRAYLYEIHREEFLASVRRFRDACEKAAGLDVRVCLENTEGWLPCVREAVELLLESPVFALTWDIGHDFYAGGVDREFLMAHSQRITHMHIHDASGIGESPHKTLGEGRLDLPSYFQFAQKHGCSSVIEVKTADALRRSEEWMRENELL